ncbi:MAG: hypothetical protein WC386_02980 [Candidatus Paceibacterota bacterium]|jgi:hypothetical protein
MDAKAFFEMGLAPQRTDRCGKAPENTARALHEMKIQGEMVSLNADVMSAILLAKKGWHAS